MGVGGEYKKQDWDSESVTVLVCDSDEEGEEICSESSLECSETLVFYTSEQYPKKYQSNITTIFQLFTVIMECEIS